MTIEEKILNNANLIFENFKDTKVKSYKVRPVCDPKHFPEMLTDNTKNYKDKKNYVQEWDIYPIKIYAENYLNRDLIKNKVLIELFENNKIGNIYYFEMWGNVIEHTDPDGIFLRYPQKQYSTLIMSLCVPTKDLSILTAVHNNVHEDLCEGKFFKWDVANIPHRLDFDGSKADKRFKAIHIDYFND